MPSHQEAAERSGVVEADSGSAAHDERSPGRAAEGRPAAGELILEELVVEDVSIDGMCGVY